jgi:hypothetical protein
MDVNGDGIPDLLVTNGQDGTLTTIPGIGTNRVGTGFFNDASSTTSRISIGPVRQTVVVDPTAGVALTQQGTLVGFNPTTGATFSISIDHDVNALDAHSFPGLAFPVLFTANDDGTVSALFTTDGQNFAERSFADGVDNPSALEVLDRGAGLFEAYLTDADTIRPVVVTLDLRADLVPVGNPLAVVATLVTDLPHESSPSLTPNLAEVFNPLLAAQASVIRLTLPTAAELDEKDVITPVGEEFLVSIGNIGLPGDGDGVDEEAAPKPVPTLPPPTLQQFITGVRESLEQLGQKDEALPSPPDHDPDTEPPTTQSSLDRPGRFDDNLASLICAHTAAAWSGNSFDLNPSKFVAGECGDEPVTLSGRSLPPQPTPAHLPGLPPTASETSGAVKTPGMPQIEALLEENWALARLLTSAVFSHSHFHPQVTSQEEHGDDPPETLEDRTGLYAAALAAAFVTSLTAPNFAQGHKEKNDREEEPHGRRQPGRHRES